MTLLDPIHDAKCWLGDAEQTGMRNPNAACMSTLNPEGYPEGRIVLIKEISELGFVFYTNSLSQKGRALAVCDKASLVMHWDNLGRQLRVLGNATPVSSVLSDMYFASRPRDSQIGAWASLQSEVLPELQTLTERISYFEAQFFGKDVPRPPHWFGYALVPQHIEFWTEKPFRLHERVRCSRHADGWQVHRLYP